MTSSSVIPRPISGVQPSSVSSVIAASDPARHRRDHRVAEAAPGAERVVHGRRLVAAVNHTVTALVVTAPIAVGLPLRRLDELAEGLRVALLQEIAGALPAEHVVRRVAPRGALEVLLTHEELEEQRRLVELPAPLRVREHRREQLVGALATEEMLLVGRLRVAVTRRDHHALHAEVHHRVEELAHSQRVGAVEERRVGRDAEAAPERLPDPLHRLGEDAVAADRLVVLLAEAVHVDAEGEVLGGLEEARLELLLEEDRVGAEVDVLLPRHERGHEAADFRVHERLAARDRHQRRAALVHRGQALLHAQVLLEDLRRVLDLAAPRACEVAAEEGLQHEDEGITCGAPKPLLQDVGRDRPHLGKGNAHACWTPSLGRAGVAPAAAPRRYRIVAAITTWSATPTASSVHSPIHAVTARLNTSTT